MTSTAATFVSGDILGDRYEVKIGRQSFVVHRAGQRITFSLPQSQEPFGSIRFGSPSSGAIWIGNDLVGEFSKIDDDYAVIPVVNGRTRPNEIQKIDPVAYLIQRLNFR